jgi:hypothetical protein
MNELIVNLKKDKKNRLRYECPLCSSYSLIINGLEKTVHCFKCDETYSFIRFKREILGLEESKKSDKTIEEAISDRILKQDSLKGFRLNSKKYIYETPTQYVVRLKNTIDKSLITIYFSKENLKWLKKEEGSTDNIRLYKSTFLSDKEPLYLVEGEKDVETMRLLGFRNSTTLFSFNEKCIKDLLKFNTIIIIPDHDDVGLQKYHKIKDFFLVSKKSVPLKLNLTDIYLHISLFPPPKSDISDALDDFTVIYKKEAKKILKKLILDKVVFLQNLPKPLLTLNELNLKILSNPFLITYDSPYTIEKIRTSNHNLLTYTEEVVRNLIDKHLNKDNYFTLKDRIRLYLDNRIDINNKLSAILNILRHKPKNSLEKCIETVLSYLPTESHELFKAFLFQSAGRYLNLLSNTNEYSFSFFPLLYSAEKGSGKSVFVKSIFSCFNNLNLYSNNIKMDFSCKDDKLLYSNILAGEVSEIEVSKKAYNKFKSYVLLNDISVRKPYERDTINYNIHASIIATSNHNIMKEVGERRFFSIDYKQLRDPEILENISKDLWHNLIVYVREKGSEYINKNYTIINRDLHKSITSRSVESLDINCLNVFLTKLLHSIEENAYFLYRQNSKSIEASSDDYMSYHPLHDKREFELVINKSEVKTVLDLSPKSKEEAIRESHGKFTPQSNKDELLFRIFNRFKELGITNKVRKLRNGITLMGFLLHIKIIRDIDKNIVELKLSKGKKSDEKFWRYRFQDISNI